MKRLRHSLIALALPLLLLAGPSCAQEASPDAPQAAPALPTVTLLSEQLPPFNYIEDGRRRGISADTVREIRRRLGKPDHVQILPFLRAYRRLRAEPMTGFFSLIRSPWRENLFKWVGPIAVEHSVLLARKRNDIDIDDFDDINARGLTVGAQRGSPLATELQRRRIEHIELTTDEIANARKLATGRIALWHTGRLAAEHHLHRLGEDFDDYSVMMPGKAMPLWIAFNPDTPDTVVRRWQQTLDQIKADGVYARILARYGG